MFYLKYPLFTLFVSQNILQIKQESELGEDDVILFEWKLTETEPWVLFLKDINTHQNQCACCGRSSDDLWHCECELVMYCND